MFCFEFADLLPGGWLEFRFESLVLVEADRTGEPKPNGIGLL
jgi:hypothetical protein